MSADNNPLGIPGYVQECQSEEAKKFLEENPDINMRCAILSCFPERMPPDEIDPSSIPEVSDYVRKSCNGCLTLQSKDEEFKWFECRDCKRFDRYRI
jgi:hypothetical protein